MTARVWDAVSGKTIGPPLAHKGAVCAVAFTRDGRAVLTGSTDDTARVWAISELPDDLPRLTTWVEYFTGLEVDGQGRVRTLDNAAWRQRRERLNREGGPPESALRWRLDPIVFGPEPTARARAWIERERWGEAEAAFDVAVLARPSDSDVVLERARFHAARSQPDKAGDDFVQAYALGSRDPELIETISRSEALFRRAVAQAPDSAAPLWSQRGLYQATQQRWAQAAVDFGEVVRLKPEYLRHRQYQLLSHAAAAELDRLGSVRTELLNQFGLTNNWFTANNAAWFAALVPGVDAHLETLVRLAELAVNRAPNASSKGYAMSTLGAALYRAARFEDALRRLEESTQLRSGISVPQDWAFLAMTHHRLRHRDEARRYLERLRSRQPSTEPDDIWSELEIRLLQSEAEATILFDPIFPVDPFAKTLKAH
jgi:tetratricopeptide (TPR) repeat protein